MEDRGKLRRWRSVLRNNTTAEFGEDSCLQSRSTSVHIPSLIARVDMSLEVPPKTRIANRDQVSPQGTLNRERCRQCTSCPCIYPALGSKAEEHIHHWNLPALAVLFMTVLLTRASNVTAVRMKSTFWSWSTCKLTGVGRMKAWYIWGENLLNMNTNSIYSWLFAELSPERQWSTLGLTEKFAYPHSAPSLRSQVYLKMREL